MSRRDDRDNYDQRTNMVKGLSRFNQVTYHGVDYEDLLFSFDGKKLSITDTVSGADIADYDAIFLIGWFKYKAIDDVARAITHYARAHNIPFSNSEAYDGRSFTKLSQCVIAALNKVPVTPFLFCIDQKKLLSHVQQNWPSTPYIAKAIAASRGNDNFLITNHSELAMLVADERTPARYFIIQQYIPNDGDYRILVAGNQVRMVIHRQGKPGSHLNNTSQGGDASLIDMSTLPEILLKRCLELAKLFKREITGIDMIQDKYTNNYYFLEINNMPQLATGSFVDQKISMLNDYLQELAHNQ